MPALCSPALALTRSSRCGRSSPIARATGKPDQVAHRAHAKGDDEEEREEGPACLQPLLRSKSAVDIGVAMVVGVAAARRYEVGVVVLVTIAATIAFQPARAALDVVPTDPLENGRAR